ncbi:MAG TPA: hypothetical protein VFM90_06270 [Cyclobacteriaceae bacterium]|nr:hypothetical protein [Cyclobacteriaceae bacterium]
MGIAWIVPGCLAATSLMTAFSYYTSAATGKQFREPVLLNGLLSGWANRTFSANHPAGWLIHFGVGLLFMVAYHFIFRDMDIIWVHYVLAGFFSGIIGVSVWYVVLNTHPDPPRTDRKSFYAQLIPAHIVFGLGAYAIDAIVL